MEAFGNDAGMTTCPRQADGIEINEVADGFVVYQPDRERVHYLNHTAAIILKLCDGELTTDAMPQVVQDLYNLPERPVTEVAACLEKLFEEGLIA